jgi:hypothetical protein
MADISSASIRESIQAPVKLQLADSEKRFGELNIKYQDELQRVGQLRSEIDARDKTIGDMKTEIETIKKKK